jgi:hypothetical protein
VFFVIPSIQEFDGSVFFLIRCFGGVEAPMVKRSTGRLQYRAPSRSAVQFHEAYFNLSIIANPVGRLFLIAIVRSYFL